ncbi:MAG: cyclic nucleotide-gated ion channel [Pseudomonadota bacterium]
MSAAPVPSAARARWYRLLAHDGADLTGRVLRGAILLVVVVSVAAAMIRSMPEYGVPHALALNVIQLVCTVAFAAEYALRIWVAPEEIGARDVRAARLAYIRSVPGLIDLVAAFPFTLAPYAGLSLDWLDIVPVFKLLRHTTAFHLVVEAVYSERRVLGSAAVLMFALLVFWSSVVYFFEREAQPDKYSSIPASLWWGIITLTTVGYGDITPVTPWGKVAGGLTTVIGLCLFAIPVGIIASAFIEAARRRDFVDTWNLVAKVPLFRALDAARIAAIAGVLRPRRAARGERLITKGEAADAMYFIVSGEVEVDTGDVEPAGQGAGHMPRRKLRAGDFFGEVALLADRPRTATVTALTPCRLLVLHKDDFQAFMDAHPQLKAAVREAAARRLAEMDSPG